MTINGYDNSWRMIGPDKKASPADYSPELGKLTLLGDSRQETTRHIDLVLLASNDPEAEKHSRTVDGYILAHFLLNLAGTGTMLEVAKVLHHKMRAYQDMVKLRSSFGSTIQDQETVILDIEREHSTDVGSWACKYAKASGQVCIPDELYEALVQYLEGIDNSEEADELVKDLSAAYNNTMKGNKEVKQ